MCKIRTEQLCFLTQRLKLLGSPEEDARSYTEKKDQNTYVCFSVDLRPQKPLVLLGRGSLGRGDPLDFHTAPEL